MTSDFCPVEIFNRDLMMMRSQNHPNFLSAGLITGFKQILGLIFTLLFLLPTPVCLAQDSTSSNIAPEPAIASEPISPPTFDTNSIPSEKVSQFVQAYLQVLELIDRRQGELLGAETKLASKRLEREIETQALEAIEQAGLTQQEYLQLLSLANMDPEFSERIAASLEEARN